MGKYKKIVVTEREEDLIMGIRNYQRSYPNGHPQLLWYLQQVFDELIESPPQYVPTSTRSKKTKP